MERLSTGADADAPAPHGEPWCAGGLSHHTALFSVSCAAGRPDDHVDAGDLIAFGRLRHLRQHQMRIGNVDQLVTILEIEVVMSRHVGIENDAAPVRRG